MAAKSVRLGPGTFTFGETGTPMDASCQLSSGVVSWDKDTDDPIRVLCGDTVAGSTTYSATIAGSLLQDLGEEDGLVAYTWANKGKTVPFEFVPNNAAGATVTGSLVIDPLDVGSDDDFGAVMSSDFEWDIIGEPILTWDGAGTNGAQPMSVESQPSNESAELAGV